MDFKVLIADSAITDLKEIVEFVAQDDADAECLLVNGKANPGQVRGCSRGIIAAVAGIRNPVWRTYGSDAAIARRVRGRRP